MKVLTWLGFVLVVGFGVKFTLFSPNFNFDFSNLCFFCEVKMPQMPKTPVSETPKPIIQKENCDYECQRLKQMQQGRDQIEKHGRVEKKVELSGDKQKIIEDIYREKGCVIIQNGQPVSEKCN